MKGIIYCRVSSHEQTQGTSLGNQQTACEEYARHKNITIEKIFVERGESATAANRAEFIKALEYCNKKDIEAFIVWKIDRFARNTTDHFNVRAMLAKYNTTLHSVTEPITNDPQGQLMETMLAGFAQFENEIRKQRCTSGMQGSLRKGLHIWSPKFGYKRIEKKIRRVTAPDVFDEPRASLLRKGMLLYAEGNTSISELAKLSKKWGLYTRTGKILYKQRWSEFLTDKYYAGIITDPWTGEEHQGAHEPLISLDTYNKIQLVKAQYGRSKQSRLQKHPRFPLRGFIRCSTCNCHLTGSKSKGRSKYYEYYHCKNKDCVEYGKSIPKDVLEKRFVKYLQNITPIPEYVDLFNATVMKVWENKKLEVVMEKNNYSERISALKMRLARIHEMRAEDDIDKATYKKMRTAVEQQLAGLEISENETQIKRLELETRLEYAKTNINNLARVWQDVDITQQIKLQQAVLPNGITFCKTNGRFGTAHLSYLFSLFQTFPMEESVLVAGSGLEPESGGYEPPEIPLLHPAICFLPTHFSISQYNSAHSTHHSK